MTSVLVVYDGWANLRLLEAVAIILGPVVAMVIGHVFAATLAAYPTLGRPPRQRELVRIVQHESHFLLVCAPQLTLLLLLSLVGLNLSDTVRVLIWAGAASLGFWGGLAAQRAGLRWRGIALGVITGLAAGGAVLLMQVFLQPGKAVSNGVATIELATGAPRLAGPARAAPGCQQAGAQDPARTHTVLTRHDLDAAGRPAGRNRSRSPPAGDDGHGHHERECDQRADRREPADARALADMVDVGDEGDRNGNG